MGTDEETGTSPESTSDDYVKRSDLEDLVRSILHDKAEASAGDEEDDEETPDEEPRLTLTDIERVMEEKVAKAIRDLTSKREARPKPPPKPPTAAAKEPEPAPESPSRINFREKLWGSK